MLWIQNFVWENWENLSYNKSENVIFLMEENQCNVTITLGFVIYVMNGMLSVADINKQ